VTLIPRRARARLLEDLSFFRSVLLQGARQVGKSTLATAIAAELGARVVTLDDIDVRDLARSDPGLLLDSLGRPAVIDEVQRGGDGLVLALKARLDTTREKGQFLLTGSSGFLTTPGLSESLAGRMGVVELWPLSVGERLGGHDGLVGRLLDGPDGLLSHGSATVPRDDYLELLCTGGMPEVQELSARGRGVWFDAYLETVLRREIESAADLRKVDALERMARLLLASTGDEMVAASLAQRLGIDRATASTYEPWLESAFLVHRVAAWGRNLGAAAVKRPKLHAVDTGLAAASLGKDLDALRRPTEPATGRLLESFVVAELAKQVSWAERPIRLHHLRETGGIEIDAVLQTTDGRVCAVEVKASTRARPEDARHLATVRDRLDRVGGEFVVGVVLHTGEQRLPLGDRIVALPIADLWT